MSQVFTGVAVIVDGFSDAKVLAELVSSMNYETLKDLNKGRPLSVSEEEFDSFMGKYSNGFVESGMLDDELMPTGKVSLTIG